MADAILEEGVSDVLALAQSLDRRLKSDRGYRWLREFFLYDYRTSEDVGDKFALERIDNEKTGLCIPSKGNLFFSEWDENKEDQSQY